MRKQLVATIGWILAVLLVLAITGVFLADHLTPRASGAPSHTLPVIAGQTAIDQEVEPILAKQQQGHSAGILLTEGLDAFAARGIVTRQAGRSLDVQYYIWGNDITGQLLLKELLDAADRGVRVRMLLDDISISGSGNDPALLALSQHENFEVRVYNPFRNREGIARLLEMVQCAWSINHRMHNKAWIADNRIAIVGGRNVGLEYFDAAEDTNFRDLDLLLVGNVADQASGIFDDFWNSEAAVPIEALISKKEVAFEQVTTELRANAQSEQAQRYTSRVQESPNVVRYFAQELTPYWSDSYQILSDPPLKHADGNRDEWLYRHILRDLASASENAYIISPYFVPDNDSMQLMFKSLIDADAQVGIVTNSMVANDVLAVHSGYMQYRKALLEAGFKLFEMRASPGSESSFFGSSGASLHTKAYLLDRTRGFIGSFNMDSRSINLNTEMGVAFDNPALYASLYEEYTLLASPKHSYEVRLNEQGELRWLEGSTPEVQHSKEPESNWVQRSVVKVLSWLPIKSQL